MKFENFLNEGLVLSHIEDFKKNFPEKDNYKVFTFKVNKKVSVRADFTKSVWGSWDQPVFKKFRKSKLELVPGVEGVLIKWFPNPAELDDTDADSTLYICVRQDEWYTITCTHADDIDEFESCISFKEA